jgi:hypothetical protein
MLPSFCLPRYQYGVEVIVLALLSALLSGSVSYVETKWPERPATIRRRHVILYRRRLIRNRGCIQLGLNLMSPGFIDWQQIAGDTDWTRRFLEAVRKLEPPQFNAKYHELTGYSFMSLHNKVA